MTPLTIMDPQFSLREYLVEVGLPEQGPFVLIDEDDAVRRIAKELGQDLPPEACYLEQLWVRVNPAGVDEGGALGGGPDWVPIDAKIHIDFVGGTPQGRAWAQGTGEIGVETLLGSDVNVEAVIGPNAFNANDLTADGLLPPETRSAVAAIGALRSALLAGSTFVVTYKHTLPSAWNNAPVQVIMFSPGALRGIYIELLSLIHAYGYVSGYNATSDTDSLAITTGALNRTAFTILTTDDAATKVAFTCNGLADSLNLNSSLLDGSESGLVCFGIYLEVALQSLTVYLPQNDSALPDLSTIASSAE